MSGACSGKYMAYRGYRGVANSGTKRMCTVADRGLQSVQVMCTEADRGA